MHFTGATHSYWWGAVQCRCVGLMPCVVGLGPSMLCHIVTVPRAMSSDLGGAAVRGSQAFVQLPLRRASLTYACGGGGHATCIPCRLAGQVGLRGLPLRTCEDVCTSGRGMSVLREQVRASVYALALRGHMRICCESMHR